MYEWLQWLSELAPAVALRRSSTLYVMVNAAHILSIGLLVGAILPLDLRLIGVIRHKPASVLAPFLSRCAGVGLVLAVVSGVWLFSVKPTEYVANPAFLAKISLVALGAANVAAQHWNPGWHRIIRHGGPISWPTRFFAALSLSIWIAAIVAGRWIGFL